MVSKRGMLVQTYTSDAVSKKIKTGGVMTGRMIILSKSVGTGSLDAFDRQEYKNVRFIMEEA